MWTVGGICGESKRDFVAEILILLFGLCRTTLPVDSFVQLISMRE